MSFTSKRLLTKSMRSALTEGDPYFDQTVLLLHGDGANNAQNNTFLDSSTNNFTITRNGTPTQGAFSPFALNGSAYSPTLHGGSAYFNGNGNFLYGSNSIFDVSAGNSVFTFECWVYPFSTTNGWLFSIGNGGAFANNFLVSYNQVTGKFSFSRDDGSSGTPIFSVTSTGTYSSQSWYHVAITKTSAGVHTLYVNGVNNGSATSTGPFAGGGTTYFVINGAADSGGIGNSGSTYYISNLRFTKGAALYTSNFTSPTSPVTLLSNGGATPSTAPTSGQVALLCDFTNGGIIDNTKKNNLLTPSTAKISTSQVKYGTGSMYFDGTGASSSNITGAYTPKSSSFALPAGTAFTMECWVNLSNTTNYNTIIGIYDTTKFDSFGIFVVNGQLQIQTNGGYSPTPSAVNVGSIASNTWTHIAVCGTLPNLKAFINGTMYTVTLAATAICTSGANCYIGYWYPADSTAGGYCTGYIDDLRITKGIARYTSAFTPPTRALPDTLPTASYSDPYFDQTVLLLHGDGTNLAQNNTFLDSSTNNFTITRTGTPTQGSFSPYALNGSAYSPTLHGGSGSFNPSGTLTDYLTLAANSNFAFGTGDFTVEFWMYPTANVPWLTLCGTQPAAITDSRGWNITITNGSPEIAFWSSGQFIPAAITLNQWNYVSVTRSGTTLRMFINGTIANSTTNSQNFTFDQLGVGCTGPGIQPYKGYISNMRIVKGLAVYTSNFTPPTSPVTLLSNGGATPSTAPTSGQVALLCDFTNGGIFDNTKKNNLTTVGDAKVSTSVVKYGTGSMYFDGTGDYLTMPDSNNFALGTGNSTIEFWIYATALIQDSTIFAISTTANINDCYLQMSSGGALNYRENGVNISTANLLNTNTWTHVAIVRNGGTRTVYVNGTSAVTGGTANITSNRCSVGAYSNGTLPIQGYIDDLRITKGIARYTSAFTPPTRALPDK